MGIGVWLAAASIGKEGGHNDGCYDVTPAV